MFSLYLAILNLSLEVSFAGMDAKMKDMLNVM
jgi:hypothetical protein